MFIDTHCHLNDERFTNTDIIVDNFRKANVGKVINVGYNLVSSIKGIELSQKYKEVYFAVGVHPSDIAEITDKSLDSLAEMSKNDKCVAIGEIGLDYHYSGFDKKMQIDGFIRQIELASRLNLPISIHSRDATSDTLDILKQNKSLLKGGVMHCFSGSLETAKEFLKLGLYISFAGTVTFKNASNLIEVAKYAPFDMFLTETDSPYLTPHPFRGECNEPKMVVLVAEKLAEIKGQDIQILAERVNLNAKNLFRKLK